MYTLIPPCYNTVLSVYVTSSSPDTACPCVHCAVIPSVKSSGLGPERSGGIPMPPEVLRPLAFRVPASDHLSNNPSHMWSSRKRVVFPFVKSSCWTTVSFRGSVRKEADVKVAVLFMCTLSISVGATGPSSDSELNNETRLRPSTASHLFRAAVCTFRCTSPVAFMMDNSVTCCLWPICLYTNLTFDLRHLIT